MWWRWMPVNTMRKAHWHRIKETLANVGWLRAMVQHDTFQRGDETSDSRSFSFAFYGKNYKLVSNISRLSPQIHIHTLCHIQAFWCKTALKKQRFCSFVCIHHLWVAGLLSWIKQPIVCVKGTIWHFDQYDCFLAESYNKCSFYILFFNMWLQVSAHSQLSLVKKASAS